ncbi:unnamed protein product [Thlaspi arvense]|uniref:Uncharacterized protein n=1 Tax=Thlaspi arvense TaxID=13288 RepID=A0AAU9RSY6_THLAR|nr:unnamed protein product [Thlaspi arvense]
MTFEVMDPYDNQTKLFQTSIHYTSHNPPKYFVCRPKPDQKGTICFFTALYSRISMGLRPSL